MRRIWIVAPSLVLLAGCGPWVIEPERPTPSSVPSVAQFADARRLIGENFGLDDRAFVVTDDGLVFVVQIEEELHLMLSRDGNAEVIEVLATVEALAMQDDGVTSNSHIVTCPEGVTQVRHYLFGQDSRDITRSMIGLRAVGGEVVDGLWVMPILDTDIAPEQRWEIRDGLGSTAIESGTGAMFQSDGNIGGQGGTLCRSVH